MRLVERAAVTVTPKKPYITWANNLDEDGVKIGEDFTCGYEKVHPHLILRSNNSVFNNAIMIQKNEDRVSNSVSPGLCNVATAVACYMLS